MPVWQIDSFSYNSAPGAPRIGFAEAAFLAGNRYFGWEMARSLLTYNPARPARRFASAIVPPTLRFMLRWQNGPMSLNAVFRGALRDFSSTNRIGELSQGVAYAYWRQNGYRVVADYVGLVASLGHPHGGGASPDYVMCNPTTGDVALMEVKGTTRQSHWSGMYAAQRQCDAALPNGFANRGFSCVLMLNRNGGGSSFHYRDPEVGTKVSNRLRHEMFRRSYASWFELSGDADLARWCRHPIRRRTQLTTEQAIRLSEQTFGFRDGGSVAANARRIFRLWSPTCLVFIRRPNC